MLSISRTAVWSRELHYQSSGPGPGWGLFIMYVCANACVNIVGGAWVFLHILVCAVIHVCACVHSMDALCRSLEYMHAWLDHGVDAGVWDGRLGRWLGDEPGLWLCSW
jgi:hypothetical protein